MTSSESDQGIVVGVDGSAPSTAAVRWAALEAAMRHRPLRLLHVIPSPPVVMWPDTPVAYDFTSPLEDKGREMLAAATTVAREVIQEADVSVDTKLIATSIVPTLIDLSKDADLIVVGCRGSGTFAGRLMGSVSRGILHHSHCPVAVIHDEAAPVGEHAPVIVGIDGSPASEAATAFAFDEAARRKVDLVAVHAWSDFAVDELPGIDRSDLEVEAEEALAVRLAGWQERYPDVKVRRVIALDNPARRLLEQSHTAQLTVVGSHGRGGFSRLLLGSVSSAVAESARTPVVVVPSR